MKKTKIEQGITLIALIITIVILLILAAVAINSIQNGGIIEHAQNVTKQYDESISKEETVLKNYMEFFNKTEETGKGGTGETPPSGDGDNEEDENTEILEVSLTLDKTTITKEIETGSTATEILTATLTNATGTLIWTSSNTSVAEVTGNGNAGTVTLNAAGTATITVSYESYSATCTVTVTTIENNSIEICLIDKNDSEEKYKMFTVKKGMTWEEFVNDPEYNTIGLTLWNDAVVYSDPVITDAGDYATINSAFVWSHYGTWGTFVFAWEEIIDDGDFEGFAMASPGAPTYYSKAEFTELFEAEGGTISYWVKE